MQPYTPYARNVEHANGQKGYHVTTPVQSSRNAQSGNAIYPHGLK